jgi:hypothetical protein
MKQYILYIGCVIVLFLFSTSAILWDEEAESCIVYPTFESCSYYVPCDKETECRVHYRKSGEIHWNEAFVPYYDKGLQEFRGSLVRLSEDTSYEIQVRLFRDGKNTRTIVKSFTTWTSTPVIAKTIPVSQFKTESDGTLSIVGLKGTSDGWIKIVGDVPVHGGIIKEAALILDDCQYLIFEKLLVSGGFRHGIKTNAKVENVRFVNCEVTQWGRESIRQNQDGHYLDRNGKMINNDGGITVYRSKNVVIERCYVHDPIGYTNPWNGFIELGELAGQKYTFAHPQGPNAVYVMQAGGGLVLRYNDFIGSQTHRYNDPVEGWENRSEIGGLAKDADVYGNVLAFGQDDAIEMDGGQCNVRIFDNRMEQTYCGISTAPNRKGPSYIYNNVIWNQGNSMGLVGNAIKNGGGDTFTQGMQYLINNTIIHAGGGMAGVGYGKDSNRELFNAYLRNNIIYSLIAVNNPARKGYNIYDPHRNPLCDFDYDFLGNICEPRQKGEIVAVEGSEKNAVYGAPAFVDLEQGLLTLRKKDKGIDKGMKIPNFTDGYKGKAPDLGAFEYGSPEVIFPRRPVDMVADKYLIRLSGKKSAKITVKIGKMVSTGFCIRMSDDMKPWLKVTPSMGNINSGDTVTLTLEVVGDVKYTKNGMVLFRLDDGFSIPITIME